MEVRDLWPDSIAAVGSMSKNSIAFKILKKIENHLYLNASKIIVVTESFKKYIIKEHQIKPEKVGVFKNGVITNNLEKPKLNDVIALKKSLGLVNKTIISYIAL